MDNLDLAIEASKMAEASIMAAEIACDAAIVAAANGNNAQANQLTTAMKNHLIDYDFHTAKEQEYLDLASSAEQAEQENQEIYQVTNGRPGNKPRLFNEVRYRDISKNSIAVRLIAARVSMKLLDLHGLFSAPPNRF